MEPERSSPAPAQPGPSSELNKCVHDVVQHLLDHAPHADFFRNAVSCAVVTDYRNYVPADKEMYLSKILERAALQHYLSIAAFRADLELIYENAVAYNGRQGGKYSYEPVIHWAADMLAAADEQLRGRIPALSAAEVEQPQQPRQSDVVFTEREDTVATAVPVDPTCSIPAGETPSLAVASTLAAGPCSQQDTQQPHHPALPAAAGPPARASAGGSASPRLGGEGGNGSAGQQSSSPSSGSGGEGSHSGLEALLAAVELAAEQDSAALVPPPRSSTDGATAAARAAAAGGAASGGACAPTARLSYPGCPSPSSKGNPGAAGSAQALVLVPEGAVVLQPQHHAQLQLALQQQQSQQQQQHQKQPQRGLQAAAASQQAGPVSEEPAGSSEDGAMAVCPRSGGGGSGAAGGAPGACSSYLTSNAFKNRRHKSKVYIKPNKVVYLPTTFVEEEFDVSALPLDCELRVEADGILTDETFRVTIKAVPRQGLSTMYCMTNVMRFQQQYLNWQIYNWTRIDNNHIKIHLQSPSPSQSQLQRPDLDRAASMPENNRGHQGRSSDDGGGGMAAPRSVPGSLKRKSDTGRYVVSKVERRMVPEPNRDWPVDLRLSSNGFSHRPSPIPESPPASPQRRVSAGLSQLPPRGPSAGTSQSHMHMHPTLVGPNGQRIPLHQVAAVPPGPHPYHLLAAQQGAQGPAVQVHGPQGLPLGLQFATVGSGRGPAAPTLILKQEGGQGGMALADCGDGVGVVEAVGLPFQLQLGGGAAGGQTQLIAISGAAAAAALQQHHHNQQLQQQRQQQQQQQSARVSLNGAVLTHGVMGGVGAGGGNGGGPASAATHRQLSRALLVEQQLQELSQQLHASGALAGAGAQGEAPSLAALQFALATALQQQQQQAQQQFQQQMILDGSEAGGLPVGIMLGGSEGPMEEQNLVVRQQLRGPAQTQAQSQGLQALQQHHHQHQQPAQAWVGRSSAPLDLQRPRQKRGSGDGGSLDTAEYGGYDVSAPRDTFGGSGGPGSSLGHGRGAAVVGMDLSTGALALADAQDVYPRVSQRAQQPQRRQTQDGAGQSRQAPTSSSGYRGSGGVTQSHHLHSLPQPQPTQSGTTNTKDGLASRLSDGDEEVRDADNAVDADTAEQQPEEIIRRPHGLGSGVGLGLVAAADLGLGRITFDLGAGGVSVGGASRTAGFVGRRSNNGIGGGVGGAGAAAVAGLDLSTPASMSGNAGGGAALDLMNMLSPSKRFKVAINTAQLQAAAVDTAALSSMEVGLLEVAMGLRAGQLGGGAATGVTGVSGAGVGGGAEAAAAALAGLRPGGSFGPVVQVSPDLMGQLL